jgi:hypothetical protein
VERISTQLWCAVSTLQVIRGDQIEIENLDFIWDYMLARGVHTALAGGKGKSQLARDKSPASMALVMTFGQTCKIALASDRDTAKGHNLVFRSYFAIREPLS